MLWLRRWDGKSVDNVAMQGIGTSPVKYLHEGIQVITR